MRENTTQVLNWILADEGPYTEAHGLGGATNHGITLGFFKDVWAKDREFKEKFYPAKDDLHVPGRTELKELTPEGAAYIYANHVLPYTRFNEMPPGLDYVLANTLVMQGISGGIKLLQNELGVKDTGKMNAETMKAISLRDPKELAAAVLLRQAYAKMHDKRVGKYGRGWANRGLEIWNRTKELYK